MTELKCVARLKLDDGKLDEFKRLAGTCLEIMREKDSGTLEYEIYIDEAESECILVERYRDSAALIEHNANLGSNLGEMLATGSISAEIFGDPGDEIRAMVEGGPVRIFAPLLALQREPKTPSDQREETS